MPYQLTGKEGLENTCTVLQWLHSITVVTQCTVQSYSTAQYSTIQYIQYSIVLYCTVQFQYNTVQYETCYEKAW